MNLEALRQYLSLLAREGYAVSDGGKNPDGSATIHHKQGPWRTVDTYFGGEPYGGNEVVFHENRAVWMMVYYGAVEQETDDVRGVYDFLKAALADTDEQFPVRGPRHLVRKALTYVNDWQGGLERFSGTERILTSGREVYSATYSGGLVDQRAG